MERQKQSQDMGPLTQNNKLNEAMGPRHRQQMAQGPRQMPQVQGRVQRMEIQHPQRMEEFTRTQHKFNQQEDTSNLRNRLQDTAGVKFLKQIQKLNIQAKLIERLKSTIISQGQFSPKVQQFMRQHFKGKTVIKIQSAYQRNILKFLLEPIFAQAGLKLSDLSKQKQQKLYSLIGNGVQDDIVEFMQQHLDEDSQFLPQIIQKLHGLHKQPQQMSNQDQVSEINPSQQVMDQQIEQDIQEQSQQMRTIRRINQQTQNFSQFLQVKKNIKTEPSIIENIMSLKFNRGALSQEIDGYIKSINGLKKVDKNKLLRAYDQFFRAIQLPEALVAKLTAHQINQQHRKALVQLIKKGEQLQLREYLLNFIEQSQQAELVQDLVREMKELRPVQVSLQRSFSANSAQRSLKSITQSPVKRQSIDKKSQPAINSQNPQLRAQTGRNQQKQHQRKKSPQKIQIKQPRQTTNAIKQKQQRNQNSKNPNSKIHYVQKDKQNVTFEYNNKESVAGKTLPKAQNLNPKTSYDSQRSYSRDNTQDLANRSTNQNKNPSEYNQGSWDNSFDKSKYPQVSYGKSQHISNNLSQQIPYNYNQTGIRFNDRVPVQNNQKIEEQFPTIYQAHNNSMDRSFIKSQNFNQAGGSALHYHHQKPSKQVRYVLFLRQKDSLIKIKNVDTNDYLHRKRVLRYKTITNDITLQVFELQLNQRTSGYIIQTQGDGWFIFKQKNKQNFISRNHLLSNQFHKFEFVEKNKIDTIYSQLIIFYFMAMLNQFSKSGDIDQFWYTLLQSQKYLGSKEFYQAFYTIQQSFKQKKINFGQQQSRLFLNFLCHTLKMQGQLLNKNSQTMKLFAQITNFQECSRQLPFIQGYCNFKIQTQIVLKCMFQRYNKKLDVNWQAFLQHFYKAFEFSNQFYQRLQLVKQVQQFVPKKAQLIYPNIKEIITLYNNPLFQFIVIRLTIMNFEKNNNKTDELKRTWLIQMVRQICAFVEKSTKEQIQALNQELNKLQKQYYLVVKDILHGKSGSSSKNYNLFHHETFYDFLSEIVKVKKKKKLKLNKLFFKEQYEQQIQKSIQYVIQKTQKYSSMIAFICSSDKVCHKFIENVHNKIEYKNNILDIVQRWYGQHFNQQNEEFFTQVFLKILTNSKFQQFNTIQFIRVIEMLADNHAIQNYLYSFSRKVFQNIKKMPTLQLLKSHLLQIRDIKQEIKFIYLTKLATKLQETTHTLEKLQKIACEILCQPENNILKQDRNIILRKLFQNRNDKKKQKIIEQVKQFYVNGRKQIKVLGFYPNFNKIFKQLIQQIQEGKISYGIVENMRKQKNKVSTQNQLEDFQRLGHIVQQIGIKIQGLKKKNQSLVKILKPYGVLFNDKIQQLLEWSKNITTNKIQDSLKKIRKYQEYLDHSNQILGLMKIPLWKSQMIVKIKDLLQMRLMTINQFDDLIQAFKGKTLSYQQFKKYFNIQIMATILQRVKDQTLKQILKSHIIYLDERTLQHCALSITSINQICRSIEGKDYFEPNYLLRVNQLKKPSQDMSVHQAFNKIMSVSDKFKQIKFDILQDDQQIMKAIVFKHKYKGLFQTITAKKIDSSTVLNQLKQYINDVQYSILKIQDVKELQSVVYFSEIISKATSFKGFLRKLRDQVQIKKLKLSNNIYNVYSKSNLFEQMLDSCANRQTSFKYDIEKIFRHSTVRIKNKNGIAHVQIQLKERQMMDQGQNRDVAGRLLFTFKKLTQLKDKAILLVSDFKRSAQNQITMQQTIDLFKIYLDLYKVIQQIQISIDKAIIYGLDPQILNQQKTVQNRDFSSVQRMKTQIQNLSKNWIQGMKQIYDKSYLLTHFMGPKLNSFINDTLEFNISPLIKHIINIDEKQFKKHLEGLRYVSQSSPQNQPPIARVERVSKMFQKLQKLTLDKSKTTMKEQRAYIKCRIQLVTCHKVENYYLALVKGKSEPKMNEILYCQKQTSFQEVQIFIKRAIIKYHRKHYFIGVRYLPISVQLKFIDLLNEYLKTEQKRAKFTKCSLCFIDNSAIQKVYLHLCKKQLFNAKQITDSHLKTNQEIQQVLKIIGQTYLIQSRIAGLGKTYLAERKKPKSKIVFFSISGHIHFSRLLQRLKAKQFKEDQQYTLIIQIGHVQNKNKLQIFLFQIIFFKGFNFKQLFFLPKDTTVVVEMENVYETEDKYQSYSILKIIKENKTKYTWINNFQLQKLQPDFTNIEEAFTYYYLLLIGQKRLDKDDFRFQVFETNFKNNPKLRICSPENARELIKHYFCDQLVTSNTQATFSLLKSLLKLLFVAFKTFSHNIFFSTNQVQSLHRANKNLRLDTFRMQFLNCCIRNSVQFLQATINTNQFNEEEQKTIKTSEQEDFRKKLSQFPFLIMPAHDFERYEFVYLNTQGVDISIKSFLICQTSYKYINNNKFGYDRLTLQKKLNQQIVMNLFEQKSLQKLSGEQLERQLYKKLHMLSGSKLFNIPDNLPIKQFKESRDDVRNYSITLDNFFKMCLIIQRAISHVPIIIMGESGVGKTALIRFLVQTVFQHIFLVFNIHAGIDEQKLVQYYREILKASDKAKQTPSLKVWVFFDQFNTTDQLSYIKEMIIDRRFEGQSIPQNVVLIGACNPYRKRKQSKFKLAGIKKKFVEHKVNSQENLAFKVKPPSLSMIQFMWDYQQLQLKQNQHYISKMLESLGLQNSDKVVQIIATLHQDFKKNYEISSVSLRDVARFKQLYVWFLHNMPKCPDSSLNKIENPNYNINKEERAISLSIAFCYTLRIADRQQRKQLLRVITQKLQFENQIEEVVHNQQIDYVERLKISNERIAINFSLRQNVFTTLVCLMNKIPILIIGNPGNSKSLSIRMISSNLRGKNSQSKFCQNFPELNIIYFQGSQACTSKGVQAVFQKAIESNQDFKKKKQQKLQDKQFQNCILFDQIGLAEKSIHNPLKVLHSKLETNNKQICFIAISNWQLDAAKMSRFLVLSRSNPQKQELRDTAVKILESYLNKNTHRHEKTFSQMSDWYYEFIKQWDQNNKDDYKLGFFGLRDFYCYIKYVAEQLQKQSASSVDDIIRRAIQTNFDGQQGSVELFLEIAGLTKLDDQRIIQPIRLVEENLNQNSSRCLLLIVKGDALLPIIKDKIKIKGQKQRIQCFYGSTFALDQQSQEYNLQITSTIISHMSRGTILTFKNPNNSIQTSLYDVFNKSFTYSGPKKYCRVAVGANSNPKCVVNDNFGAIVFMDEWVVKNTDLAFLNRFEKHFLTLSNVLEPIEKQIVEQINIWIRNLLKFSSKTEFKKSQNYLINSSQQSIATLVIKQRSVNRSNYIKKIKKSLLKNATQHFHIALKAKQKGYFTPHQRNQVIQLLEQIQNQRENRPEQMNQRMEMQDMLEQQEQLVTEDKIIFTYDQSIYSSASSYRFHTDMTYKIRISEVKSERQLRKSLKDAFSSTQIDNIHILIDFQKEFQHVNFVAFLLTGLKNQLNSQKTIYIIIKLSQSSLSISGRDHINISYLLDFQQLFIDSLTLGQSFMQAIQSKTIKQLYIQRKMQENFDNYYIQAQKRFRLLRNQKDTHQIKEIKGNMDVQNDSRMKNAPKRMSASQIQNFQFGEMMRMNQNIIFRKQALSFIYQNLSDSKIDISIVLNSKEDRNICSSPQQSFEKFIYNAVINVVCCFFERVYRNGMLFSFEVPRLFQFYRKFYDVQILEIIYDRAKEPFDKFLVKLLEAYVKNKENVIPQYNKAYNSNPLEVKSLCLLPMALRQLEYISSTNQDSLFKTSSKILQLSVSNESQSVQQCQILMEKCMSILNEKSVFLKNSLAKRSNFDFELFLNQNKDLQVFYFFDMISKIYSETINTAVLPLQKLVYLFVTIFKKLEIKQKVILLALSKQLWSQIFNIWSLWISYEQKQFHKKLQIFYQSNKTICQQRNQTHELPRLLIELCRSTLQKQQELLRLDMPTIQRYGISRYLQFFSKTYYYSQKVRLTCMDLKLQTSQTMKATKRFFDLLNKIFKQDQIQEKITMFLTTQQRSFQAKVLNYLSHVLQQKHQNKKQAQLILSYLSLDIYSSWLQRLKRQIQDNQQQGLRQQLQTCINTFIDYCDIYSSFANNSSFFLQGIFDLYIEELNSIEEKLEYLKNLQDKIISMIDQKLDVKNNFAVALGNFLMYNIKQCVQSQEEEENQVAGRMNEGHHSQSFLKSYFVHFEDIVRTDNYQNKVIEVMSLEFLKYYCVRYLQALSDQEQQDVAMTSRIDSVLNLQTKIADTLRLYLLKKLLYQQEKMTRIKQLYLDSKKCKWLQHFRQSVSGKTFQLLVPPPFNSQSKISMMISKYRDNQYQKIQQFYQILTESFVSPIAKYEFLTFMMNDVYTRSCPQDRIKEIKQIVNRSDYYMDADNEVQHRLVQCYIGHRVTECLKFDLKQLQLQQKKIQDFVVNQLTYLNYLNIFIACRKCQCPLIQMFFDMRGNTPPNYFKWLEDRFLLNGRENQCVSILKRFIQLNDNTPGYYKCSQKCDMFYTIGGSGGFGCQLPKVEGRCGCCNGIIGGLGHVLTRARQGARKVDLTELPKQMQIIRQKSRLQILNHKLNGYSYSQQSNQMKKEVQQNKRVPLSVKYILQQMLFTVWSFLSSAQLIEQQQVRKIFQMDTRQFQKQSYKICQHFNTSLNRAINLNHQDQSGIIWHLGISKGIMKFIIEYKQSLSQQMKKKMGLIKCVGRDTFEQYLADNVILEHSSGNQKIALINRSRCVKAGVNISGQQILRQTGGYEQHLKKYPKIRLIKLLHQKKAPCFQNLVKQYRQIINRDYKVLAYFIQNQREIQILSMFRVIYNFCTKILKLFNMKITRRDAQKKSIGKIYEEIYEDRDKEGQGMGTSSLNSFREQVIMFCDVWNELRQMKFELQYGCHTLGKMDQVTQKLQPTSMAMNFFPDNKYKGDQRGQMLLSLLQVSSQQYNIICTQITKRSRLKYHQVEILNAKAISPTQVQTLTKTLNLSRQIVQNQFIANFSNWSVEYGYGLPHYSLDKIQTLIVEEIVGIHLLSEQMTDYDSIGFIGEQLNFISQIRQLENQLRWDSVPKREQIEKYIYSLKHDSPDTFLKQITSIKGSLQLILHYCRLQKGIKFQVMRLQEFIRVNKIMITSKQLSTQQLFQDLQMKYILAFYEFIELYTLKNSAECLDDSYKKQKLSEKQDALLKQFFKQLNKEYAPEQDVYYCLTIALYRFVARRLLLVEIKESMTLFQYIYTGVDLWPDKFDLEKLVGVKHIQEVLSMTLTKMQSLLDKMPFKIKESKTQAILKDQNRTSQESTVRNLNPEKITRMLPILKKKKNL